jgi:hypothetical protein
MVNFGSTTFLVMEGSWIAARHQGRANVKKDPYGFWTVGFKNKEDLSVRNPYAFLEKVSQVFFVDDSIDADIKVVLRHEPRGKRTTEEDDVPFFGAYGAEDGTLVILPFNHDHGIGTNVSGAHHRPALGETVVQGQAVGIVDANARLPDTDVVYNDVDHEDDIEEAFGDI